jgi:hypothetical protein
MDRRSFIKRIGLTLAGAAVVGSSVFEKQKEIIPELDFENLPMVRGGYPELLARDLVEVQPMSGPTGIVFHLDYKYHE